MFPEPVLPEYLGNKWVSMKLQVVSPVQKSELEAKIPVIGAVGKVEVHANLTSH